MSDKTNKLIALVSEIKTVDDAAKAALKGYLDLLASAHDSEDDAAFDAALADARASVNDLAAAIPANAAANVATAPPAV